MFYHQIGLVIFYSSLLFPTHFPDDFYMLIFPLIYKISLSSSKGSFPFFSPLFLKLFYRIIPFSLEVTERGLKFIFQMRTRWLSTA